MKFCFCMVMLIAIFSKGVTAQSRYFTKAGKISFSSNTPLSAIEAHNTKAVSVVDFATGQIEFSILLKGFEFEKARMQEDFNENFVESDKYPKAVFAGTIKQPADIIVNKDGTYNTALSGSLTLHGVTKPITAQASFIVKSGSISAQSEFSILVADYNIKIPSLVAEKIAKTVKVSVSVASYEPLSGKN